MFSNAPKSLLDSTDKRVGTGRKSIVSKSNNSRLSVGAVILQAQQAALNPCGENEVPNMLNTPHKSMLQRGSSMSVSKSRPSTGMKSLSNHNNSSTMSMNTPNRRLSMSNVKSSSSVSSSSSIRRQSSSGVTINTNTTNNKVLCNSTSPLHMNEQLTMNLDHLTMEEPLLTTEDENITLDILPLPSVAVSPTKSTSSMVSSVSDIMNMTPPSPMANGERTQVMIRIRPCEDVHVGQPNSTTLSLGNEKNSKKYAFDTVFGVSSAQQDLFLHAGVPALQSVLGGFNSTIMAYGQTGSGKTHTVKGTEADPGLVPRCVQWLFQALNFADSQNSLCISYLEVYKEEVFDLLSAKDNKLVVRKKEQGFHAEGQSQVPVQNVEEALRVLNSGDMRRRVSSTKQNDRSSRSHAILTFTLNRKDPEGGDFYVSSKLNLVDLAGSERYNSDKGSESVAINKSLTNLALVIKNIVEKSSFVNYRDSELTKLLQDSLSGQSRTTLIACVHGDKDNHVETLSTLRFANTAKNIPVRAEKYQGTKINRVEMERRLQEFRKLNEHLLSQQAVLHSQIEEERKLQQEHLLPQVEKIFRKLDSVGLGASSGRFNYSMPMSPTTAKLVPMKLSVTGGNISSPSQQHPLSPLRQLTNSLHLDEQSKTLYNNLAGLVKVTDFLVSQYQPNNGQIHSPTSMKMIASLSNLSPNSTFKRNITAATGFTCNNNSNLVSPVVSKRRALIRLHAELVAQEARNRTKQQDSTMLVYNNTLELDEIAELKLLLAQKDAQLRLKEEEILEKEDRIEELESQVHLQGAQLTQLQTTVSLQEQDLSTLTNQYASVTQSYNEQNVSILGYEEEIKTFTAKLATSEDKNRNLQEMFTSVTMEKEAILVDKNALYISNTELSTTCTTLHTQIHALHAKLGEFTSLLSNQQTLALEAVQMQTQNNRRQSNFSDQVLETLKMQMEAQNDNANKIQQEKDDLVMKIHEKEQLSIELTAALQRNLEKKERLRAQIQHLCAHKFIGNEDIDVDSDIDVDEEHGKEYCQTLLGIKTVPRRISTGRTDCANTKQPAPKNSGILNISMFTSGLRASRERNRRIAQLETQF